MTEVSTTMVVVVNCYCVSPCSVIAEFMCIAIVIVMYIVYSYSEHF